MSAATFAAAQLLRALPRVKLSRAVGRLCEQELPPLLSRVMERAYVAAWRVDMADAEREDGPYRSFDDFFTRSLRPGARQIADAPVVCPADGALCALGRVEGEPRLDVKGKSYSVSELCGDAALAARYVGGSFAVIYLSPRDYHRVHSPVDGRVVRVRGLPGDSYPVNQIGERHFRRLFVENRRVVIEIESETAGHVTVVMVGAMIVGRITVSGIDSEDVPAGVHCFEPARQTAKGEEIAVFHLGSTVVLLVEAGQRIARGTGRVLYGQALASR